MLIYSLFKALKLRMNRMQNIFFAKKEFSFKHMNDKSIFYLQYLTICSVALWISALSRGAMQKSATLYVSYLQRVAFVRFFSFDSIAENNRMKKMRLQTEGMSGYK